ncbi:MAG: SDR family NAD(P)-dependent oxidoreductase [Solirubrobacteraceae bacterium]
MSSELAGRVAAVTGASSGIGEATALALAGAGAAVAVGARRADRLEGLVEKIQAAGGTAIALPCDVTEEVQAVAFVNDTHAQLGRLDILVNNAGLMLLGPVEGADLEEWRRMIAVNCLGLLYTTHAALPLMREGGGGHVVNVSSVAGRRASAFSAVYNLTKWGVNGFSEALRQEALHSNIRVTVVEPGWVETELLSQNTNPLVHQGAEKLKESIGEVLSADDIAGAILYAVVQPDHVSVSEVLVRPTKQPT